MGLTMADLNYEGAIPEIREELMALVKMGQIQYVIVQSRGIGIGSAGDVERSLVLTNRVTCAVKKCDAMKMRKFREWNYDLHVAARRHNSITNFFVIVSIKKLTCFDAMG